MAILNLSGAETGDTTEYSTVSGTASVQSSVKRSGGYAVRTNPTTTAVGAVTLRTAAAWIAAAVDGNASTSDSFVSFYFRYATGTLPASGEDEPIFDVRTSAAATKLEVRITNGAALRVYLLGTTLVGTSSTTLTAATWYLVEVRCGSSATIGPYDLRINGVSQFSGTGNTSATVAAAWRFGKTVDRGGNSCDFYFDDIIISNSAFVGAGAVEIMVPTGAGNYSAWTSGTGSTFAEVDDVPSDGNTSYLAASATSQAHTLALEDTSTAGISGTLNGVKALLIISRNTGTNGTFQARLRGGSTDVDSADLSAIASYSARSQIITTNPNGGAAWTTGGLDALELGVEDTHASARTRWSAGAMHVHFLVPPSATGALGVPVSTLAATVTVARAASGAAVVPVSTLAATAAAARAASGALLAPAATLTATTAGVGPLFAAAAFGEQAPLSPFTDAGLLEVGEVVTTGSLGTAAADELVCVCISFYNANGGFFNGISDSAGGNTWTQIGSPTTVAGGAVESVTFYSVLDVGGADFAVTVDFGALGVNNFAGVFAMRFNNVTGWALDQHTAVALGSATSGGSGATGTRTVANELLVGWVFGAGGGELFDPDPSAVPWTTGLQHDNAPENYSQPGLGMYAVVSSTGTEGTLWTAAFGTATNNAIATFSYGGAAGLTATGALVAAAASLSATGTVARTLTGAGVVPASTLAATGAIARTLTGALLVPGLDLAGTAAAARSATGALVLPASVVAAVAQAGGRTAAGALLVPVASLAGTATVARTLTGALVGPGLDLAAAGTVARTAAGLLVVPGVDLAATVARAVSLTGAGVVPGLDLAATGATVRTVAGVLVGPGLDLAAVAAGEELTATAALVGPGLDLAAAAVVARTLAGGLAIPALDLDAAGVRLIGASAAGVVPAATLAATTAALERLAAGLLTSPALELDAVAFVGVLQPLRLMDATATAVGATSTATALPTARAVAALPGHRTGTPL